MSQHCPTCTCGKPERETRYRLNSGHVSALQKLRMAVHFLGKNEIHIRKEMYQTGAPYDLTFDELTNFAYLRVFGLAVHADPEHTRSGKWLFTPRGAQFLRGEIAIRPVRYATKGGHPKREEGEPVTIRNFRGKIPEFYEEPSAPVEPKTATLPL